jgi:hypothetical protein
MSTQLNSNQKVLDFVKRAGSLIEKAEKREAALQQKEAAVAALIPDVVETLISNGHIDKTLRDKAASYLTDHVKALELLTSVAAYKSEQEVSRMGNPEKTASARSNDTSYRGGSVVAEDDRPSSRGLAEAILGNR